MRTFLSLGVVVLWGASNFVTLGGEKAERPIDRDFLIKVANANQAEIQYSQLADKRASSNQVKDFASMLVKDHKGAGDKLADLLKGRKLAIVTGLDKDTRDEASRLGKLEGVDFDRAYLHCMIKEHKSAIAIFENQAKNGQESDIRDFAKTLLPDLRQHLKKAEQLAKSTN
jgi:putative membrane protein